MPKSSRSGVTDPAGDTGQRRAIEAEAHALTRDLLGGGAFEAGLGGGVAGREARHRDHRRGRGEDQRDEEARARDEEAPHGVEGAARVSAAARGASYQRATAGTG